MSIPTEIKLHQKTCILDITFDDGSESKLPCEYLRVFSPSAEVRGHGSKPRQLVAGKKHVKIVNIEPVGNYAIKLIFDDGHSTGIYTWEILQRLSRHHEKNWQQYLTDLAAAGLTREP